MLLYCCCFFFFSSRRRHTRFDCDWSSDVCSSDLSDPGPGMFAQFLRGESEEPSQWHNRDPRDREHDHAGAKDDVKEPADWDEDTEEDGPGVGAERAEVHRVGKRPAILNLADNL